MVVFAAVFAAQNNRSSSAEPLQRQRRTIAERNSGSESLIFFIGMCGGKKAHNETNDGNRYHIRIGLKDGGVNMGMKKIICRSIYGLFTVFQVL